MTPRTREDLSYVLGIAAAVVAVLWRPAGAVVDVLLWVIVVGLLVCLGLSAWGRLRRRRTPGR